MNGVIRKPIPRAVRERVAGRFGGRCGYCGAKPEKVVIDHVVPIERSHLEPRGFDVNAEGNLMPACSSCNNYKTCLSLEEFRRQIGLQVSRARENSVNFRLAERFGQLAVKESPIVFLFELDQAPR